MLTEMENLEVPKQTAGDIIHSISKGIIGAIPLVGGLASEVFEVILTQPISKRREKWMQLVVERLKYLEQSVENFKIENLKNDDAFVTFLIEASHIAIKTHQDEKLNYLKNSIANYFQNNQIEFDKKHSFLRIIDNLSLTHFHILIFLSNNEYRIVERIKGYEDLLELYSEQCNQMEKYDFRKFMRDLENESLIRISRDFQDFIGMSVMAADDGAPSIKLLDSGKEFIEYIIC